jgi:hypothetical protein
LDCGARRQVSHPASARGSPTPHISSSLLKKSDKEAGFGDFWQVCRTNRGGASLKTLTFFAYEDGIGINGRPKIETTYFPISKSLEIFKPASS